MRRMFVVAAVFALVGAFAVAGAASAQVAEFGPGFNTVASLVPDVVGLPLEGESFDLIGNSTQPTTSGMFVYHKLDNTVDFTNGSETWVMTSNGLLLRNNSELFNFEFVRQQLEDRLNAQLVPGMTSEQTDALIAQAQLDMQLLEAQLDQPDALIP